MFEEIITNVKKTTPLVECITNCVTINDCANALLACGAAPIMAEDINEIEEIVELSTAIALNIGTMGEQIQSMFLAGRTANRLNKPIVLDPVGAGASTLRTNTTLQMIDEISFTVIRGNVSEINTIAKGSGTTRGVEANVADKVTEKNLDEAIALYKNIAAKTGAVIAVSGAIDIVADANKAYVIRNGHPTMTKVTGTGCMLTTIIAAYCGANPTEPLKATAAAVCMMGLCGEIAFEKSEGTASFRTSLIDAISNMTATKLASGAKFEIR